MSKQQSILTLALIAVVALGGLGAAMAQEPGLGAGGAGEIDEATERWERRGPNRGHWGAGRQGPGALAGMGLGPGIGRGRGLRVALRQLDLSESQIGEIRAIFESERETAQANHQQMRALGDELREQIEADPYDEETVRAKAGAVAAVGVEMAVLRARQAGKVLEVLTPDQVEQLESMKAERKQFREHRRERFEERRERFEERRQRRPQP